MMLIGPIPYITRRCICLGKEIVTFVPDYNSLGVKKRVKAEVDMIEDMCWIKGRD